MVLLCDISFVAVWCKPDKEHLILTADKGVALAVVDRSDYTRKMKELLDDNNTYRPLKMDPTNRQKNRLINILRRIKTEARLEGNIYKKMYPTGASSPQTIWASKDSQEKQPPEAHCIKQGFCHIWGSQRVGQNFETPDWEHHSPCQQFHGICR